MKKQITVTKPYFPPKKEYMSYLDEIWENGYLTNNGPMHRKFETQLKKYLKVQNVTLTVNGHSALDIAVKGLDIKGEVITTPFTFVSTTHSLTLNGITPVFCDIKESDLTIDETKIEKLITKKTTAIMPVHVYGHMCNVKEIERIAKKHNLKVIYDAAHTFGITYKNESLINNGDVSILSFHATKIFNTIEGGALIYKDNKSKRIFEAFKNFGIEGKEQTDFIGENAKMNEFQAAMGLVNLNHIDNLIIERKKIAEHYYAELAKIEGIKYFNPNELYQDYRYNYAYLPILVDKVKYGFNRNELYDYLEKNNIYARKYFYPIITDLGCYKEKYKDKSFPIASRIGEEILCLPLYNGLKIEEVDYIIALVKKLKNSRSK